MPSNGPERTILVTGATGNQGGAVVKALLTSGTWKIRALSRTPDGPAAQRLTERGVEVVGGDLTDRAALAAALHGVHGVFSVQNYRTAGRDGEVRQGVTLAEAATTAGVKHLVYSSVGGAERVRGIPHFDTKWQIEQRIAELGVPSTILRPAMFMDMFTMRGRSISLGMFAGAVPPQKTMQMIAVEDIGVFARHAFEHPESTLGQALELAGDALTVPQIAAALGGVRYLKIPLGLTKRMGPEMKMILWFGESGYQADIPALRAIHPGLLTFERWLRTAAPVPAKR
jgi:uncharacterized protein YbjT (DUF2867 family)